MNASLPSFASLAALTTCLLILLGPQSSSACCAVAPNGTTVVNADQTVLILWDPATKMQHFVRKASFRSDDRGDRPEVGFIVPSPSRPELDESGGAVFRTLASLTAPPAPAYDAPSLGCSKSAPKSAVGAVRVIERKRVAGFDAVVLQADQAEALSDWLKEHNYAASPELAAWAAPYVRDAWYFVALKVAGKDDQTGKTETDPVVERMAKQDGVIDAAALRISFETEQPLFPYREPASTAAAKSLGAPDRLLRIYLITDQACAGGFGTPGMAEAKGKKATAWNGEVKWCGDISDSKAELLHDLGLPPETGPAKWMLTEFENNWAYADAPGDVVFTPNKKQKKVRRSAATAPGPANAIGLGWAPVAFAMLLVFLVRRTAAAGRALNDE